jgi:hypothetical protein
VRGGERCVRRSAGPGRACRAATLATAVLALGGCSPVAEDDRVEAQIRSRLGTDSADCPGDLRGEVGRSIVCTATKGDDGFDVTVTVIAVEGTAIDFEMEPVLRPAPTVDGRDVAQSVFDELVADGKPVDRVSCPDLAARVGASQRCTLASDGVDYGVTVTVSGVRGTDVEFSIQVDRAPR